jgi:transketolase
MTLDQLKRFRQIDSKTAGHLEYDLSHWLWRRIHPRY